MPYLKCISIRTTVDRSLRYILNPDKTEELLYTSALNCLKDARNAYLNMQLVYEQYSGRKFNEPLPENGKGHVKALHYIQSFSPEDNVSTELAHRIAKAFVRKTFGDSVQTVIATHCDKRHVHSHIIICSYGIDGHHFTSNKTTLAHAREYSDRVAMAFGIQPMTAKQGKGITYGEWYHRSKGTSWKQRICQDIDSLVGFVSGLDELLSGLESQGYTVRRGESISVKAPGQKRAIRLKTLGEGYAKEILAARCSVPAQLLLEYESAIAQIPVTPMCNPSLEEITGMLNVINRDRIHSIGELEFRIEDLKAEHDKTVMEVNKLKVQAGTYESLAEEIRLYRQMCSGAPLSREEYMRLRVCEQNLEQYNIRTDEDMDELLREQQALADRVTALEQALSDCTRKYNTYAAIAKTYRDITSGDYISRLIAYDKHQKDKEKQQTVPQKKKGQRR
ncbi:MAG: relaxase/mobilization nuclease domain-containing protein [Ruminiclostridium sp.]|nr:relaxase/mobilization nuclease domain-containing protein [Ruminiclostridium sp.]